MGISEKELRDLLSSQCLMVDVKSLDVQDDFSSGNIDSLDQMNILLAIEEHYNIKISDEDVSKLSSLRNIIKYLNSKVWGGNKE